VNRQPRIRSESFCGMRLRENKPRIHDQSLHVTPAIRQIRLFDYRARIRREVEHSLPIQVEKIIIRSDSQVNETVDLARPANATGFEVNANYCVAPVGTLEVGANGWEGALPSRSVG